MFQGDKKVGQSLLHAPEIWLRDRLLPCVPRWMETNHLTLTSLLWSVLIIAFSYLARRDIAWLWGVSLMIAAQYVTDLLDGAIGRQRNTGLVKWGFYMDHFLDFLFLCAILIGYAILIPQAYRTTVFFILAIFAGFMVNSFLAFACTNRFQIAYLGIGPTEIRIVFILINAILTIWGPLLIVTVLPYLLTAALLGLFITVYTTQQELWRIDMAAKQGHEAQPLPPPSRHRRRFVLCLVTAAAGLYLAWIPHIGSFARTGAIILLTAAVTLLLVSVADVHRLRQGRRLLRHAALVYAPYAVVALLLIAGLRIWLVLEPTQYTGPTMPSAQQLDKLLQQDPVRFAALRSDLAAQTQPLLALPAESPELPTAWDAFIETDRQLDQLGPTYAGFLAIDTVAHPQRHDMAFALCFGCYVARNVRRAEVACRLIQEPALRRRIDRERAAAATRLIRETASDTTGLRLNAGQAYWTAQTANRTSNEPIATMEQDLTAARIGWLQAVSLRMTAWLP